LANVSALDIEIFLWNDAEVAVQIVAEHVDSRNLSTDIVDKYLRKLALKVSKNSHYKYYVK